jgi:hypothetical protein
MRLEVLLGGGQTNGCGVDIRSEVLDAGSHPQPFQPQSFLPFAAPNPGHLSARGSDEGLR